MFRIPLPCFGSTVNFEFCQPHQPATLCPGDALKLIAGDRKLSSWEVCVGMAFRLSWLLPFWVTLLNCYFEIQWGIEIQWADADFSVASSCIRITLRTYRPMAHNPSIPYHSQRVSCTKPTRNIVHAVDYSFQYVLLTCWRDRLPRIFSAPGRQTSTWAPILWSLRISFSFAPSKSRQLAARKGGHVSVATCHLCILLQEYQW